MYQDRKKTSTTLCFIHMLPFVAVGTVLAILAIWLLTWANHLVHIEQAGVLWQVAAVAAGVVH